MNRIRTIPCAAALALLAACGGGGGSSAPEPEAAQAPAAAELPVAALASTRALANFAAGLARSDSAEPLDISRAVLPTSETEEPAEI